MTETPECIDLSFAALAMTADDRAAWISDFRRPDARLAQLDAVLKRLADFLEVVSASDEARLIAEALDAPRVTLLTTCELLAEQARPVFDALDELGPGAALPVARVLVGVGATPAERELFVVVAGHLLLKVD